MMMRAASLLLTTTVTIAAGSAVCPTEGLFAVDTLQKGELVDGRSFFVQHTNYPHDQDWNSVFRSYQPMHSNNPLTSGSKDYMSLNCHPDDDDKSQCTWHLQLDEQVNPLVDGLVAVCTGCPKANTTNPQWDYTGPQFWRKKTGVPAAGMVIDHMEDAPGMHLSCCEEVDPGTLCPNTPCDGASASECKSYGLTCCEPPSVIFGDKCKDSYAKPYTRQCVKHDDKKIARG